MITASPAAALTDPGTDIRLDTANKQWQTFVKLSIHIFVQIMYIDKVGLYRLTVTMTCPASISDCQLLIGVFDISKCLYAS